MERLMRENRKKEWEARPHLLAVAPSKTSMHSLCIVVANVCNCLHRCSDFCNHSLKPLMLHHKYSYSGAVVERPLAK